MSTQHGSIILVAANDRSKQKFGMRFRDFELEANLSLLLAGQCTRQFSSPPCQSTPPYHRVLATMESCTHFESNQSHQSKFVHLQPIQLNFFNVNRFLLGLRRSGFEI
jgi:hypothetical protein